MVYDISLYGLSINGESLRRRRSIEISYWSEVNSLQFMNFKALMVGFLMSAILLLSSCSLGRVERDGLLIFAAASLGHVIPDLISEFKDHSNVDVLVSYGGSQALAQQISSGAPADLFISAGSKPIEFLVKRNVLATTPTDLLTNKLVLVLRPVDHNPFYSLDELQKQSIERIAIADPDLAPAGAYALESLKTLGMAESLAPKIIYGQDVRSTVTFVESGNADVAFAYITDVMFVQGLQVLDIIPTESYSKILYQIAIMKKSSNQTNAERFIAFLKDTKASKIFEQNGFSLDE